MIEIVLLPYMAISLAIGWAVFSPFSSIDDFDSISFSKIELVDLLACFLPVTILLSLTLSLLPDESQTPIVLSLVTLFIFVYVVLALGLGLFLLDKMPDATPFQRLILNGIVLPIGSLLTIAWVAIPIFARSYSIFGAILGVFVVVALTLVLRFLSSWSCSKPFLAG